MPDFPHKIHAIEDSDGVTQEIVPLGLQNNGYTATLPILNANATLLTSDILDGHEQIIVLQDNGSTTAGTWLAKTDAITALAAGQIFLYEIAVAGASTTKLNITCSGTATGAKNIYRVGTTKLTTQYPVGSYIMLYFDGTYFKVLNDYDANSDTKMRQYQTGGTSTLTGNKFPLLAKYVNTATTTYVASYANYWNDTYLDTDTGKLYVNNQEVVTTGTDTNQTITVGTATFAASAAVDLVAGTNMTVTAVTSGTGAPQITFDAIDTGATTITVSGAGNVVDSATYNPDSRMITLTKGVTAITAHQGIKVLNTNNTTSQTVSASEAIAGSGTINLHRVAKSGSYLDLLNIPWTRETDNDGYYCATTTYNALVTGYLQISDDLNAPTAAPRPSDEIAFTDPDVYIYGTGITIQDSDNDALVQLSYPNHSGIIVTADQLPNVKRYI